MYAVCGLEVDNDVLMDERLVAYKARVLSDWEKNTVRQEMKGAVLMTRLLVNVFRVKKIRTRTRVFFQWMAMVVRNRTEKESFSAYHMAAVFWFKQALPTTRRRNISTLCCGHVRQGHGGVEVLLQGG